MEIQYICKSVNYKYLLIFTLIVSFKIYIKIWWRLLTSYIDRTVKEVYTQTYFLSMALSCLYKSDSP